MTPTNDLERLMEKPGFGTHDYPEFFRMLREAQLFFLLPRQRGTDTVEWKQPDTIVPQFVAFGNHSAGQHIPIFTSKAAARNACRNLGAPNGFTYFHTSGRNLLDLLSRQVNPIAINPACGLKNPMGFGIEDIKALADGSALEVPDLNDNKGRLQLLSPVDYPMEMVHAVLAFCRKTPSIRAAWLMKDAGIADKENCHVYILDVNGPEENIQHDFAMIARMSCPKDVTWGVQIIDSTDPSDTQIPDDMPPFYAAKGHRIRGLFTNA